RPRRQHAGVPAILLRRLAVAAELPSGQIHLDHVVDRGVAERDAGRRAEIAVGARYADADVSAGARRQPSLAGAVADVDEVLLQIGDVHRAADYRRLADASQTVSVALHSSVTGAPSRCTTIRRPWSLAVAEDSLPTATYIPASSACRRTELISALR